jgi:hypothetical protein
MVDGSVNFNITFGAPGIEAGSRNRVDIAAGYFSAALS